MGIRQRFANKNDGEKKSDVVIFRRSLLLYSRRLFVYIVLIVTIYCFNYIFYFPLRLSLSLSRSFELMPIRNEPQILIMKSIHSVAARALKAKNK